MKIKVYKTIILFFILMMSLYFIGCKKNELPPSSQGDPVLSIHGKFKNQVIDLKADNSSLLALQSTLDDSANRVRIFTFQFNKYTNAPISGFVFRFINYTSPFGDPAVDVDSTFKPGYKTLANYFPAQTNPFDLNNMVFGIDGSDGNYSSDKYFSDSSYCKIDSVRDLTWMDGKLYKMIYMSFSINMRSANVVDSTFIPFTEGRATIAFPKLHNFIY